MGGRCRNGKRTEGLDQGGVLLGVGIGCVSGDQRMDAAVADQTPEMKRLVLRGNDRRVLGMGGEVKRRHIHQLAKFTGDILRHRGHLPSDDACEDRRLDTPIKALPDDGCRGFEREPFLPGVAKKVEEAVQTVRKSRGCRHGGSLTLTVLPPS